MPLKRPSPPSIEVSLGWHRVSQCGLQPDAKLDALPTSEIDTDSRFLRAAEPVLRDMSNQLAGTKYCVFLADKNANLIDRWADDRGLVGLMDRMGAVPGAQWIEEFTGINA